MEIVFEGLYGNTVLNTETQSISVFDTMNIHTEDPWADEKEKEKKALQEMFQSEFAERRWDVIEKDGMKILQVYESDGESYPCLKFKGNDLVELNLRHATKIANFADSKLERVCCKEVREIPQDVFSGCRKLKYVETSAKCKNITLRAFRYCTQLETAIFPGVEYIGALCFQNCKKLVHLDISAVKEIGECALSGCESLVELNLPLIRHFHGFSVIRDCTNLKKINFPKRIRYKRDESSILCRSVFFLKNCPALETLILPEGVTDSVLDLGSSKSLKIELPNSFSAQGVYNAFCKLNPKDYPDLKIKVANQVQAKALAEAGWTCDEVKESLTVHVASIREAKLLARVYHVPKNSIVVDPKVVARSKPLAGQKSAQNAKTNG